MTMTSNPTTTTNNNAAATYIKPIPMPVDFTTGDQLTVDIRGISTVFLGRLAQQMIDIRAGKSSAQRMEALQVDINHAMRLLLVYTGIRGVSPLDIYMDSLVATRKQSKVLMKEHGDPLENPAPFAIVFAENVLKQVAK
jgi:hypothetical protein